MYNDRHTLFAADAIYELCQPNTELNAFVRDAKLSTIHRSNINEAKQKKSSYIIWSNGAHAANPNETMIVQMCNAIF